MNFLLPANAPRASVIERVNSVLTTLSPDKAWKLEIGPHKVKRSDNQNRYLWGVVYGAVCEKLEGWHKDDVHEYCLGEFGGWETVEGFGKKRLRPLKRSHSMNKQEFSDYVEFIKVRMAEHGIVIPDADGDVW
jgi:hypothetical protein